MQRNYNYIYSHLVQSENDIVGHIAYSLYKTQKIEHIKAHKEKHGQDPLDTELVSFNEFSSSKSSLDSYKLKAGILLQQFTNQVLDEAVAEKEAEAIRNHKELLKEIIAPITPLGFWKQFWQGVAQNILAGLVIAVIFAFFILILQTQKQGAKNVIEETFDVDIKEREQVIPKDSLPK